MEQLGEILSDWGKYTFLTKIVSILSIIASFVAAGLIGWGSYLRTQDRKEPIATPSVATSVTQNIEVKVENNFYNVGDEVLETPAEDSDWNISQRNGQIVYEKTDLVAFDIGVLRVKTVAVPDETSTIQWRYKIFSILEGASWDQTSHTLIRGSGGEEIDLGALFDQQRFKDQLNFAEVVFAIGLSSQIPGQSSEYNFELSERRAKWLASAVAHYAIVYGFHHSRRDGAPGSVHSQIFTVPLGEALMEADSNSPEEPAQRSAILIAVDSRDDEPNIAELLPLVLARDTSLITDLSQYSGSENAVEHAKRYYVPYAKNPYGKPLNWPDDYGVK